MSQDARRFRRAVLAPCLPKAVRVRLGRCAIVRFRFAVAAAFLMLRRAAVRCFAVPMIASFGHISVIAISHRNCTAGSSS